MKLSLVVPCYNEAENIIPFFDSVEETFMKWDYEIIFVNDGSDDNTLSMLKRLHERHRDCVSVISFLRNFGKEAAVLAGLKRALGDYVTVIDADLQQSPTVALEMVEFLDLHEEYDAVAAYQEERSEGKILSGLKNCFYILINKVCEIEFYVGASDFRVLRSDVVKAIISMPEYFRFSKGLFSWVGFETYYMPYTVNKRNVGESKWSFMKLFRYALEGFISFTTLPLKFATYLGGGMAFMALVFIVVIFIQKIFYSVDVPGYPTIVVTILLLGGIQLLMLGIIGEYLARTYIQGKNRPIYIEKEYLGRSSYDEHEGKRGHIHFSDNENKGNDKHEKEQ